ncbi:branched-subunit amino acid ABC-type transport system permease component [Bradyrhizobium sp. LM3.2]
MLDFVQQLVSGVALGCVYGLIALGFVLVYKVPPRSSTSLRAI